MTARIQNMIYVSEEQREETRQSSDEGFEARKAKFEKLQTSLYQLNQSMLALLNAQERLKYEIEAGIEKLSGAAVLDAEGIEGKDTSDDSGNLTLQNTNNNCPVHDDVQIPVKPFAQPPLLTTTSASLVERAKVLKPFQFRFSRKNKVGGTKSQKKKKQDYFLVPLITGVFGDVLQKKPNGKPKYTDLATIIDQGTAEHKNIDTASSNRYEPFATIEERSHCKRLYYVKPVSEDMVTLQQLMMPGEKRQVFTESQAKFVCANLLLAAQFLHENDITHGSIMPKKIVFNDKYYPQIAGFSTAEILTERMSRFRERLPLQYMAPELCYEDIYENTDIFSIAVVVYEMIFGRTPHHGRNDFETRRNLCNGKFNAEFDDSKLSTTGQKFLRHCLRKSERMRFNILRLKRGLFTSVPWFEDLEEERIFKQTFPSPLKTKIQNLRKEQKKESPQNTDTEKHKEE